LKILIFLWGGRFSVYTRPSTRAYFPRTDGQENYLGATRTPGVPLFFFFPLPGTAASESESKKNQPFFDATVLAHSLWYFATPSLVEETFRVIKQHPNTSKRLLLAEWALEATHKASQPHVLAALTQAALECRKPDDRKSLSNIRTVLGPKRLTELALAAGWQLERESRVPCGELLEDGKWEVAACLSPAFEREVREHVSDEREQAVVFALRDACEASLEAVPGGKEGVRAMDVWVASFV